MLKELDQSALDLVCGGTKLSYYPDNTSWSCCSCSCPSSKWDNIIPQWQTYPEELASGSGSDSDSNSDFFKNLFGLFGRR